ncbi:MAG: hypothetical protein HY216_08580 [Candidatus Rokubacteria bacterium]|nr:hypothetical protein [Candidatus Rokubacteria bacterium]
MTPRTTRLAAVLAFLVGLLVFQLWLLGGALELTAGGTGGVLAPIVVVSGLCFGCAWGLLRMIERGTA